MLQVTQEISLPTWAGVNIILIDDLGCWRELPIWNGDIFGYRLPLWWMRQALRDFISRNFTLWDILLRDILLRCLLFLLGDLRFGNYWLTVGCLWSDRLFEPLAGRRFGGFLRFITLCHWSWRRLLRLLRRFYSLGLGLGWSQRLGLLDWSCLIIRVWVHWCLYVRLNLLFHDFGFLFWGWPRKILWLLYRLVLWLPRLRIGLVW